SQLRQVIMNLVINAAEAIEGAGSVLVSTGIYQLVDQEIRSNDALRHLTPGEYVCLEVTDTGSGMNAETQSRIFDPFFTTKFTGRGLGLAAVSGIIRGHRAGLSLNSEPGCGTEFVIHFPIAVG